MSEITPNTIQEAADKLDAMSAAPEQPEVVVDPVPEPENNSNLMQAQQEIVRYQEQLSQEQSALKAEEARINALRHSDPAEYAASMTDLLRKQESFTYKAAQFQQAVQQFDSQHAEQFSKEHAKHLKNTKTYLENRIGWNDAKATALVNYLRKKGMTDRQISNIPDAQTIEAHYLAMVGQQRKTLPKKKLSKSQSSQQQAEEAIRRGRFQNTSIDAAAAKIAAMLG